MKPKTTNTKKGVPKISKKYNNTFLAKKKKRMTRKESQAKELLRKQFSL